ncbi:MAG: ABC transporter permease subunit [Candidatus Izimaplasma sp.]|nr:ABC transporter permease subunit [Candidatus Izimaplasma bacterium]
MNKFTSYVLAILTVIAFMVFVVVRQTDDFSFASFYIYTDMILTGMGNTILMSLITLFGSLILGFIFYLLSISKFKYFNALIDVLTEIIYGTPLIVFMVVMTFLIGPAFNTYKRVLMGSLALTFYMTPYMKNVYKSAISSISDEQYMAMDLFGFTSYQKYRYIIIPQVVRILMPPMMNNFSMIIKGSALLYVLSYNELFFAIRVVQSKTFAFIEGYVLMWGLYLIITIPLSQVTKVIERKWAL